MARAGPTRSRSVLGRMLLEGLGLMLAGLALVGCGATPDGSAATTGSAAATGSAPTGGSSGSAAPTDGSSSDLCPIVRAPGLADAPPAGGGEIDARDLGGGRWALCLADLGGLAFEGTAWCRWDAPRTAVSEFSGLELQVGPTRFDGWLSFPLETFELHATNASGEIANYEHPGLPPAVVRRDGADGLATFDVQLVVDPEQRPPPGTPPRIGGIVAWHCGAPPPAG